MKYTDIPVLPAEKTHSDRALEIREEAPKYLRSLIDDTRALTHIPGLQSLHPDQVIPLAGGQDAATYLLLYEGKGAIVKFGYFGLEAEVEALKAWTDKGVHVPRVQAHGVVPSTQKRSKPVHYIVEDALVDTHGRLAETGEAFLRHSPKRARHIGRLMGNELAKIHGTVSDRSFGDFGDSEGNTAPYRSWNNYLLDYFAIQKDYLRGKGVSEEQLEKVDQYIESCSFVSKGRYLHGDFSVRNAAMKPDKDIVVIFDPNPVIGDPSWDIAVLYNNRAFSRIHAEQDEEHKSFYHRDQQLLIGFKQGYDRQISRRNLLAAQLIQGVLHLQYHDSKIARGKGNKTALHAREKVVLELVERICKGGPRA